MKIIFAVMIGAAALAALIHILFFMMESVFWKKPAVMKIFRQDESTLPATQILAFNQGFYNLFLALGNITGIWLVLTNRQGIGFTVITSNCAIMLGAAVILIISSPKMLRGMILQGLPPLIFFVAAVFY